VGIFAKVVLAIAILVANGALLFVILRFLLWLAFPGSESAEATPARPARAAGAVAAIETAEAAPAFAGLTAPLASPPVAGGLPLLAATAGRPRAYPHRLLIGLPVILALFAGGVWIGSVVGGSGTAAAATKYIHVTGRVVTVNRKTEVRVPAQIVTVKGGVVSVPETSVSLPSHVVTHYIHRTTTTTVKLPGKTTTDVTTIEIPTTITGTTVSVTVTSTETVTVTGTTSTTTTT
jgi:hypothetical protein